MLDISCELADKNSDSTSVQYSTHIEYSVQSYLNNSKGQLSKFF